MAAAPAYASTPVLWSGLVPSTNDTSWTAPTHVTTLGSAGSNGTKITQIDIVPSGNVVAGIINIFLFDSTSYHLHESVLLTALNLSTIIPPAKTSFYYDNVVLPSGWSLVCSTTVAGNESVVSVNAYGASL
jgi:hypothetical protein